MANAVLKFVAANSDQEILAPEHQLYDEIFGNVPEEDINRSHQDKHQYQYIQKFTKIKKKQKHLSKEQVKSAILHFVQETTTKRHQALLDAGILSPSVVAQALRLFNQFMQTYMHERGKEIAGLFQTALPSMIPANPLCHRWILTLVLKNTYDATDTLYKVENNTIYLYIKKPISTTGNFKIYRLVRIVQFTFSRPFPAKMWENIVQVLFPEATPSG